MTIEEILHAIANGQKVYWQTEAYEVKVNKSGELYSKCIFNGSIQYLSATDGIYQK